MPDNYSDEIRPLFKRLKREDFGFYIVLYDYRTLADRLIAEAKALFPDRKAIIMDCRHATYEEILQAYSQLGSGFFFLDNFQDLLDRERQSDGNETPEMAIENERRRAILAGLNLRRDHLTQSKIALFLLIRKKPDTANARPLMEKLPDLWSFRTLIVDFKTEPKEPVQMDSYDPKTRELVGTGTISAIGGNTEAEKRSTLASLLAQYDQLPESQVSLRLNLSEEIITLLRELGETAKLDAMVRQRNRLAHEHTEQRAEVLRTALEGLKAPTLPEVEATLTGLLDALPENEIRVMSIFAVLPNEPIPFTRILDLLPELESLDSTLLSLAQKGWLDHQKETNAFLVSPVVQEVTRLKNKDRLFADCFPLIVALIEKLLYQAGTGHFLNATYEDAAYYARLGEAVVPCFVVPEERIAVLCERLGNFHVTLGDLPKALEFYTKGTKLFEELHEVFPSNADFKNSLAISYSKLGQAYTALGELSRALEFFVERNRLGKVLHEAFPSNVDFKNGLAISYAKLGETYSALGEQSKALECYTEYHRLTRDLHEAFPSNVDFKNGLAISYAKLGETNEALGKLSKALEFYTKGTKLFEELHEAFPSNVGFKNGLAISYSKLGDIFTALGELPKALEFYMEDLRLTRVLYEAFPSNVGIKNGLAISFGKLGDIYLALGELPKALEFYTEVANLFEELHDAFPSNVGFKNNLAVSYWKLGDWRRMTKDFVMARKHFAQAEQLWKELVAASPASVQYKQFLQEVQGDLEGLEQEP